jgi:glycosyltransferase involved in cell wall biosynthesis
VQTATTGTGTGGGAPWPRVTFVQPYVPDYRVPFFEALAAELAKAQIELQVAHGHPLGTQGARGDARSGRWSRPTSQWSFRIAGKRLFWRPVIRLARSSAVVVQELGSTNLVTYALAIDPRVRLMLWGHGKAYVTPPNRLDTWLERWQINRARHVFVYTGSGAAYLAAQGVPLHKITVVHNSTDTEALRSAHSRITAQEVERFRVDHHLGEGPVGLFVGALDDSKLIPLLLDAAALVHQVKPSFRLLVAGSGPLGSLVDDRARQSDHIVRVPRTESPGELALLGRLAHALLVPGRVGLIAADALALDLTVITTDFPFHAPEREYLSGDRVRTSPANPRSYADTVLAFLARDDAERGRLQTGPIPSIRTMVEAFASVLVPIATARATEVNRAR